jgi:hypothetical protein
VGGIQFDTGWRDELMKSAGGGIQLDPSWLSAVTKSLVGGSRSTRSGWKP